MKRLSIILFLSPAVLFFFGCKSASAKSGPDYAKPAVTHDIKISNKGTRSEGRSGYLKINGVSLPDCFNAVAADGRVYTFKTRGTAWGDDGYFPEDDLTVEYVYPSTDKKLSDADLAAGWSEVSEHYSNVPAGWIFVKWQNGSAAVSPDRIDQLVKEKSIRQIRRNTMFSGKLPE